MSEAESGKDLSGQPVADDEMNTTPPNPPMPVAGQKPAWEMPKPVFKQTSGYLPQGFEKNFPQGDAGTTDAGPDEITAGVAESPAADAATPPANAVGLVDVEPQPVITDTLEIDVITAQPDGKIAPKKGGAMRVVFVILGLLLAFGLIGAFIAVVYILFLSPAANGNF